MTIAFSTRISGPFTAAAGQTLFNYTWPLLAAGDVQVVRRRGASEAALVLGVDYTVSGVGSPTGGQVHLVSGALAGDEIIVIGARLVERTTEFPGWRSVSVGAIDDALDEQIIHDQELRRAVSASLRKNLFRDVYDAGGKRLTNLAPSVELTDALTRGEQAGLQQELLDQALAAATAAQDAAAEAQQHSALTTRGDLLTRGDGQNARLPIGPAYSRLSSDGTDPVWRASDVIFVDDFPGANDDAKILAAVTYAKTKPAPHLVFSGRTWVITSTAEFDLPDHSRISFNGMIRSTAPGVSVRIGRVADNSLGYIVSGLRIDRSGVISTAITVGVEFRNTCAGVFDVMWVRDHATGVQLYADQSNGGISYSAFKLGILHDNRYSLTLLAVAGVGYINENQFVGGSFAYSSNWNAAFAAGTTSLHIYMPDGSDCNNNKFIGPSLELHQSSTLCQAIYFGDKSVGNSFYHLRYENNIDLTGACIRFRPGSYANQIIGMGLFVVESNILDETNGMNSWDTYDGQMISRRVPAAGVLLKLRTWFESAAKLLSCRNVQNVETAYVTADGKILSSAKTGGVGYATGAGAAVVQATSKTTAVTINAPCGRITMSNSALAAGAVAGFLMVNSCLKATDVLVLNVVGGAGQASYRVHVNEIIDGYALVEVANVGGGTLSQALVLNFVILRAATT